MMIEEWFLQNCLGWVGISKPMRPVEDRRSDMNMSRCLKLGVHTSAHNAKREESHFFFFLLLFS